MQRVFAILSILVSLSCQDALASHIVGGDFSYRYLGDTVISGEVRQKYRVALLIYQDCLTGVADAIKEDNPAFFTVYDNDLAPFELPVIAFGMDSIYYNEDPLSEGAITVPANFSNDCVTRIPKLCLLRKKFETTFFLPYNGAGYTVVYQRCCRNASILNVVAPGDEGATYFCVIPPPAAKNNSAIFNNYPPQVVCITNPLYYDNSATDADGDSLSYEFCPAQVGASDADIKPKVAFPPPYDTVDYFPPYTFQSPISGFPAIAINPVTGVVTGTPNRLGRFLVTICCNEWRNGVIINTAKREFQFVVTDCSKLVVADMPSFSAAPNTYIVNCRDHTVHFYNKSNGGSSYRWAFNVGSDIGSATSSEFEPTYTYPDTGTYTIKLIVNPGTTCPDSITRLVKIYPKFRSAFADTGEYCPGVPIDFTDRTLSSFGPVTSWNWSFGDGSNSYDQNPVHTFKTGGTYNVMLVTENKKNCLDTTLQRLVVQHFTPYAGDDTIVVKGEHVQFQAQGGTRYAWSAGDELSDTAISNPMATYNDTGYHQYSVFVQSDYGCTGYDTIGVLVVHNASFVMPNAFSPNGDGLNDLFRPKAVGYRSLKFFRVFNRWGEEMYNGTTLETGWDGTWKGKPAEMGAYFWQLSYIDRFGKDGFLQGDVVLIK